MLQYLTLQLNWERTQLRVSVPVLRRGLRKPFPVQPQAGLSYLWSHNFHLHFLPISLSLSWKTFPPRLFFCQTASCLYPDQGAAKNTISSSDLSFRLSLLFLPQISSTPSYHTALDCLFPPPSWAPEGNELYFTHLSVSDTWVWAWNRIGVYLQNIWCINHWLGEWGSGWMPFNYVESSSKGSEWNVKADKHFSSSLPAGTVFKFNLSDVEMPVEVISISRGCGEQTVWALCPGQSSEEQRWTLPQSSEVMTD